MLCLILLRTPFAAPSTHSETEKFICKKRTGTHVTTVSWNFLANCVQQHVLCLFALLPWSLEWACMLNWQRKKKKPFAEAGMLQGKKKKGNLSNGIEKSPTQPPMRREHGKHIQVYFQSWQKGIIPFPTDLKSRPLKQRPRTNRKQGWVLKTDPQI